MMKQLALDIGLATGPTLARFFAGPNEAALQHLRLAAPAALGSLGVTVAWLGLTR